MPEGAFQEWCEADDCPAAICGGPHETWRNPDTNDKLTIKPGQPHPFPGYTEKITGTVADRPGKDADPAAIAKSMDWLQPVKLIHQRAVDQLRYLAQQLKAGTNPATVALAIEIISPEVAEAAVLVHGALFLRMNGERPPGAPQDPAGETWADWDRRAEAFLRGVPPS